MIYPNPTKEFVIDFDEAKIREAIFKLTTSEPDYYVLVKEDLILNETRIHQKGRMLDPGYHVDFTLTKVSDNKTKVFVEISRNMGTINSATESSIANNSMKSITTKFSAFLSGNVDPKTGKAIGAKEGCYIATAVYGNYDAPEVIVLREFRDKYLKKNYLGLLFIRFYYAIAPTVVKLTKNQRMFNRFVKMLLDRFVNKLK